MQQIEMRGTLPGATEIRLWLEQTNAWGPRLTGSAAHTAYVDWLAQGFEGAGLQVVRHPYLFTRREADAWSLDTIAHDGASRPVPVASCYPCCEGTTAEGVTGQLLHLGDVQTAKVDDAAHGRILYAACTVHSDWRPPLKKLWGTLDPQHTGIPVPPPLPTRQWKLLADLRHEGARAGALGLLIGWTNLSDENAAGQYQPLEHLIQHMGRQGMGAPAEAQAHAPSVASAGLPALWLGPAGQAQLFAVDPMPQVRMTLRATLHPDTPTETLVATLKGSSAEMIIVLTHTDGVNACQENGGIAELALARYFAGLPISERRRSLVFVATTGHFGGGFADAITGAASAGEIEDVLQWHPELVRDGVAVLGVEQLGVESWTDDGTTYAPSGKIDFAHGITSHAPLARALLEGFDGTRHCAMYVADSGMLGQAGRLDALGVPAALYMGIPAYVMAIAADGHLGKLSATRMQEEIASLARVVAKLDRTPTETLRPSA